MKIYTKTGDKGLTGLVGGTRVSKTDSRLEAYGTVDELNAHIGVLLAVTVSEHEKQLLLGIQNLLFDLGAELATDRDATPKKEPCDAFKIGIEMIENEIDSITKQLPPLTRFVLPGGNEMAARCHVCRTVARRAERRMWEARSNHTIDDDCLIFVNRLSDFFFILARKMVFDAGNDEIFWKSHCRS